MLFEKTATWLLDASGVIVLLTIAALLFIFIIGFFCYRCHRHACSECGEIDFGYTKESGVCTRCSFHREGPLFSTKAFKL